MTTGEKTLRWRSWLIVVLAFFSQAVCGQRPVTTIRSATVVMTVANNRVFVPLRVTGPNGKSRVVQFWVDSGGDTLALSGRLAAELGLKPVGGSFVGMGEQRSLWVAPPRLDMQGMQVDLEHVGVSAPSSRRATRVFPGIEAEGFLPATVLRKYEVVFDYPARTFTLAQAGMLTHRGAPVPFSVQPTTGFGRVELAIGGKTYGFMLDTGAAFTGVSRSLIDQLAALHPAWPRSVGAVGAANMVGKAFDVGNELLALPEVTWGPFPLRDVAVISRPIGVYETYVSADMTAPIVGALSGNVLRRFRLDLDYLHGTAYLELHPEQHLADLDCVGVIVQVKANGSVLISGVSQRNGVPEVSGIRSGDRLMKVDGAAVTGSSLAAVLQDLSGRVGESKVLAIQRAGREQIVSAKVSSHP